MPDKHCADVEQLARDDSQTTRVHVIAHTHWDYEWYFTQNESQIQLDYHMDELFHALESGLLESYLLDGQTSLVEDHLRNCPENLESIKRHVSGKRLLIGPWYTQSDLMIVSGESIVKNLQTGYHYASALGHVFDIAYVPDSFGQSQDMPQIFNGFGLKRFVFWRGLSSRKSPYREFIWQGADGSSLTCYNIREGYYPGGVLIWGGAGEIAEAASVCSQASHINVGVFPVGGDQRYVDFDLKEKIEKANRETDGYEFIESSYSQLFDELDNNGREKLETITGEMLDSENSKIHRSIYSSRSDHKQMNDRIERKLVNLLEPLMAMSVALGLEPKRGTVDAAWKLLLKNHAHDSACGCNSDKTNEQILNRFVEAEQRVDAHIDYLIRKTAEATPGNNTLTLFNTLAYPSERIVRATISSKMPGFRLNDGGYQVRFEVEAIRKVYSGSIQRDESQNDPALYYFETDIVLHHPMQPLAYCNLAVEELDQPCRVTETVQTEPEIEDDYYRLFMNGGSLQLFDKQQNRTFDNLLELVDQADDGDTYDYSPLAGDLPLVFDFSSASCCASEHTFTKTLTLEGALPIPECSEAHQRSTKLNQLPWRLVIRLENNGLLQCQLHINNNCRDHRLRVRINTGIETESSFADTPFGLIERPVRQHEMDNWQALGWNEEPTGIYPMIDMVNLNQSTYSVTAFVRGIKEYEITGYGEKSIELTAFRSVGLLGKPGLQRRPGKASGNEFRSIPTPDSQLLKPMVYEFAIRVDSECSFPTLKRAHQQWTTAILHYQKQEMNRFTGPLKYFVSNRMRRPLEGSFQLFEAITLDSRIVSSVLKLSDDSNHYVLRLFNASDQSVTQAMTDIHNGTLVETDLRERETVRQFATGTKGSREACCTFRPFEIKTFLIEI